MPLSTVFAHLHIYTSKHPKFRHLFIHKMRDICSKMRIFVHKIPWLERAIGTHKYERRKQRQIQLFSR
jgi:hypothetical protein